MPIRYDRNDTTEPIIIEGTYRQYKLRKRIKKILFSLILLIVIACSAIYVYEQGWIDKKIIDGVIANFSQSNSKDKLYFSSFKDINLNPEKYLYKNLTLRGRFSWKPIVFTQNYDTLQGLVLVDDEGYYIYFHPKITREWSLNKEYTISGVFTKDIETGYFTKGNIIYFLKEE